MRYLYLIFVFIFSIADCWAIERDPYFAVVAEEVADVYSGPGTGFYPTAQLKNGDTIEVYYEKGDWLAIRPPVGSFSWISAKFVDYGTGNIGVLLTDGLASRIGSDFSDDCDTVQVRLNKGEKVFVLERREMPENPVSPVWLKIIPPSGEFRWIHRSAIRPENRSAIIQARYDEINDKKIPLPLELSEPATLPKVASISPYSKQYTSAAVNAPFQKAFDELQHETYIVMTRPASDEVFAMLIQQANELYQIAPTEGDLEKTYHILESLQRTRAVRLELVKRRPVKLPAIQSVPPPPLSVNTGAPKSSIIPAYSPAALQKEPKTLHAGVNVGGYDIVGRLGEFEPLPQGYPPYAVVNEKNEIICLITPMAKLDLAPFIGQFVGINGVLGFYEKPGKSASRHITAENIQSVRQQ